MKVGTKIGLGPGDIMVDGDSAPPLVICNWMSAASVAVVVTSGERHEGKAGIVLFAGKTV